MPDPERVELVRQRAQLDRTATQFPTVRRTLYSINGSPRSFYEWLQRPVPRREQP